MPLRDDLLNPIPGANPSGENLRYAPVYDQIREARREDDALSQGEWQRELKKADWPLVVKLGSEALARKSKDLQIAAWLTEAALRREGFAGLRQGLDLMRGLVENFWDTLYPEIEDGDVEMRATPIEWIGSRLDEPVKRVALTRAGLDWLKYKESRAVGYEQTDEAKAAVRAQAVSEGKLTAEEFDAAFDETPKAYYQDLMQQLDGCLESLAELGRLGDEKFGDYAPNLGGLRKSLEEVRQVVHVLLAKKRQQQPDAGEPSSEEEVLEEAAARAAAYQEPEPLPVYAAAAAAPARAPAAQKRFGAEPADREDAIARVAALGRWMRRNDAYHPAGYTVARAARWGELRADTSLLEPPPTEVRQEIKRLINAGEAQAALDAAEEAAGMPWGRAWLDVHRYAAELCEQLGYSAPAAAIRAGLRALLADLPELAEETLADDTPAANADTRAWLEEQVVPRAAAAPEAVYAPAPEEPAAYETGERAPDVYETALEAARNGNLKDAIAMLRREAAQAASGRTRFQRTVQLAQVCLGAGQAAIAHPILCGLAEEIERRKLEQWESPETVAHALGLLYRALQSLEAPPEERLRIYNAVCRLDPVQALSLAR